MAERSKHFPSGISGLLDDATAGSRIRRLPSAEIVGNGHFDLLLSTLKVEEVQLNLHCTSVAAFVVEAGRASASSSCTSSELLGVAACSTYEESVQLPRIAAEERRGRAGCEIEKHIDFFLQKMLTDMVVVSMRSIAAYLMRQNAVLSRTVGEFFESHQREAYETDHFSKSVANRMTRVSSEMSL